MLKNGDVYFKNDILEVKYFEEPTKLKNDRNIYYPYFEINFLGSISKYGCGDTEYIDKVIKKRQDAYDLIPIGCKVVPYSLVRLFNGLFIGGIMEDSIKRVYGISSNGIRGFSCSVFFIPNQEHLDSIMNYQSIIGEFKTK